nr:phosphodiester glycosidase family protein [Shewanella submarina]
MGFFREQLEQYIGKKAAILRAHQFPENVLSSGPTLIRQGIGNQYEAEQGWPEAHLTSWIDGMHPRSTIAQTQNGTIILMVIDGRQPGYSTGISITDLRALLLTLSVWNAINLDGGGSSTLWLNNKVINRPSSGKPRAIANAILVMPD